MTDHFSLAVSEMELHTMSSLALAHIGDAVYELMVRTELCLRGRLTARGLHRETVRHVAAPAQARAAARLLPLLIPAEREVYQRARNAKVHSVPRHAAVGDYHAATALEALFGWLYLQGETQRLETLFAVAMED